MRWTIQIARFSGIPVLIHWSFWLILLWVIYQGVSYGLQPLQIALSCLLVLSVFLCVVLHEFGHALTAKSFGVNTRDIILTPIGGVARLERLPEKPMQEFLVAIAGPLVNVLIACMIGLGLVMVASEPILSWPLNEPYSTTSSFFRFLLTINIALVLFNLIPAFPMDGGRMLRALLSAGMPRVKATRIATIIGQVLAVIFLIFGLVQSELVLALIGVFVFFMAGSEYRMVQMDEMLASHNVGEIMQTEFYSFSPDQPVYLPINQMAYGTQSSFMVLDEFGNLVGILDDKLLYSLQQENRKMEPISAVMRTDFVSISPETDLKQIYHLFQHSEQRVYPVMKNGQLLGILDGRILNTFMGTRGKKRA